MNTMIKFMTGVSSSVGSAACASLQRSSVGRLIVCGGEIDLFDLLKWVDENPLTQFREVSPPAEAIDLNQRDYEKYDRHGIFAHLFDNAGNVL